MYTSCKGTYLFQIFSLMVLAKPAACRHHGRRGVDTRPFHALGAGVACLLSRTDSHMKINTSQHLTTHMLTKCAASGHALQDIHTMTILDASWKLLLIVGNEARKSW